MQDTSPPAPIEQPVRTPDKPGAKGPTPFPSAVAHTPRFVPQPVAPARMKRRHWLILLSFLGVVLLPSGVTGWYLWSRAADQYASYVGFSVRTEEAAGAIGGLLGGLTGLSNSSSKDTDILYEFLQSQKLVTELDSELDLRGKWSKPQNDPIFAFRKDGAIEDLLAYWKRMVSIDYNGAAGLIEVRVLAFSADDATQISQALFDKSSEMINDLSAIAREDAIRYSREELTAALDRLKQARQVITEYRIRNQMVDPKVDVQTQAGLLGVLEQQLAEALIGVDMLSETARQDDPRVVQAQRRVDVIRNRIAAEREKTSVGAEGAPDNAIAELVGEYERLSVDREFAEKSYITALATYDAAEAEARRKSRYLAAYVSPTHAESARFPQRFELMSVIALFLFLFWAIGVLVAYSLRDRR